MTVVPGPVETTIPAEVRRPSPSGEQELLKSIVAGATLGRIGRPAEIAVTVVFLTSPEGSCITDSELFVTVKRSRPRLRCGQIHPYGPVFGQIATWNRSETDCFRNWQARPPRSFLRDFFLTWRTRAIGRQHDRQRHHGAHLCCLVLQLRTGHQ